MSDPVVAVAGLRKTYQGLRPLRLASLRLEAGERVAIAGLDAAAAEVLVSLLTGAMLPDEGEIRVFGRSTADIASEADWLAWLDRFGIVSPRAVLVDRLTLAQNLALPLTLEVDPLAPAARAKVGALAEEIGLGPDELERPAGDASPAARARVHLGRALALDPALLVLEHPSALAGPDGQAGLATLVDRAVRRRGVAMLALLADPALGRLMGARALTLQPGSGVLRAAGGWRRWF